MSGFAWSSDLKWFKAIHAAQRATRDAAHAGPQPPLPPFDLNDLGADSPSRRLGGLFAHYFLLGYFWVARAVWPFPPLVTLCQVVCVSRAKDVRRVLQDSETFGVPYGPEMIELSGGAANFVLGMDGEDHLSQRQIIGQVVRHHDTEAIARLGRRFADALIDGSGGTIDVMTDLVTRVATETCGHYFGFDIAEPDAFAEWALSLSGLLFADPTGGPETRALALNGAARLRAVVDRAIAVSKADHARGDDTLVDRLVAMHVTLGCPTEDEMTAILTGLIVGFIPTVTLAAGRMIEELLRRWPAMNAARYVAAEARDKDALTAILWEAARLNPALQPGQWRYARRECVIGEGIWARKIREGKVLMVSTMSALRDSREFEFPNEFRTDRTVLPELVFGYGPHACMGTHIGMALISEIFMSLFARENLRPVKGMNGSMAWVGPCPRRLDMQFDASPAPQAQSMITIRVAVHPEVATEDLNRMIGALGNPAHENAGISTALTATGIVHFASMAVVDDGDEDGKSRSLLLELNVDGPCDAALDVISAKVHHSLEEIFHRATGRNEPLRKLLGGHVLHAHRWPWGAIGLDFNGVSEFPVSDIERQAALAAFSEAALDHYLKEHVGAGGHAWAALRHVRHLIEPDDGLKRQAAALKAAGKGELADLLDRGEQFSDFLIRPNRRVLKFAGWTADPAAWGWKSLAGDALNTAQGRIATWVAIAALGLFTVVNYIGLDSAYARALPSKALDRFLASIGCGPGLPLVIAHDIGRLIMAFGCALVFETAAVLLLYFILTSVLGWKEAHDVPDDVTPPLSDIKQSARSENPVGYAQNHFMAVTQLKPGPFRKLTLAIALFGVRLAALNLFRPGFVTTMGTIHYAQWMRLPGTDKLVFLANYDGSWESYLEDFIMRAHPGQSAVWSNGVGFPRTDQLVNQGAQDGDRFKRWVRRQQQIAPFWYSRFPNLTTAQIRNNAVIHHGLMRANTETAAREWLDCFGSMQRPDAVMESDEIQSLVFTGLSDLPYAACIIVEAPNSREGRKQWLQGIMPGPLNAGAVPVSFGEMASPPKERPLPAFIAFSAKGLAKFAMPPANGVDGLATFPNVFNIGMSTRGRVLGDGDLAPKKWTWSDDRGDAVLLVYGRTEDERNKARNAHRNLLKKYGGKAIYTLETSRAAHSAGDPFPPEHFGFRDGISQPIIRGTERYTRNPLPRDIVEPGEFILGYPNNLGYLPPSLTVRAESDREQNLPVMDPDFDFDAAAGALSDVPDFDAPGQSYLQRDFGRNGTFLVIRQLDQDVSGFEQFTKDKAADVAARYPHVRGVSGGGVSADWIAAKMMGRRRDGTSLVDRPSSGPHATAPSDDPDNDFAYGVDDPLGLACPLGAHVRRANPRDSLNPGDPVGQSITNRHRLLRRGRIYGGSTAEPSRKGLLFVALCADIERQFELVQQTWVGSPSFQGLVGEPDPIVAQGNPADRVFTIPTHDGPIVLRDMANFVTVRAGGYFFLPSRSALRYLTQL